MAECDDARALLTAASKAADTAAKAAVSERDKQAAAKKSAEAEVAKYDPCIKKLELLRDPKLTHGIGALVGKRNEHDEKATEARRKATAAEETRRQQQALKDSHDAALKALGPPAPVKATGATAGKPGSWTPAGAAAPADLAALKAAQPAVKATPTAKWKVEEHVLTADAKPAHWDGTGWTAGKAPDDDWAFTDFAPKEGTIKGGTPVTLKGTDFPASPAPKVKFDKTAATDPKRVSATEITCKTPAHAKGAVNVELEIGDDGKTKSKAFTYTEP